MDEPRQNTEASEDEIVCPQCETYNNPGAKTCSNCNQPLCDLADADPQAIAYSQEDDYLETGKSPPKPIYIIGMWLLLSPFVLSFVWIAIKIPLDNGLSSAGDFLAFIVMEAVCAAVIFVFGIGLYRDTRDFIRGRRDQRRGFPVIQHKDESRP